MIMIASAKTNICTSVRNFSSISQSENKNNEIKFKVSNPLNYKELNAQSYPSNYYLNNFSFKGKYKYIQDSFFNDKFYYNIYHRNNISINLPKLSSNTLLVHDIFPIAYPHILCLRPNENITSLAQIKNVNEFKDDFKHIMSALKNMYPEQGIVFFEHGSGIVPKTQTISNTAKSMTLAHGHFCVLPPETQNLSDNVIKKTNTILKEYNGANLENDIIIIQNEMFPNLNKIFKEQGFNDSDKYPPYLIWSEFSPKTQKEVFNLFILNVNKDNKEIACPSQLFRKLLNETLENSQNDQNWNWRRYQDLYYKNADLSDFNDKFKKSRASIKDFDERLGKLKGENF